MTANIWFAVNPAAAAVNDDDDAAPVVSAAAAAAEVVCDVNRGSRDVVTTGSEGGMPNTSSSIRDIGDESLDRDWMW